MDNPEKQATRQDEDKQNK